MLQTPSRLRDLVNIFICLEDHRLSFESEYLKDNFVLKEEKLMLTRPWRLEGDADG